MEVDIETTSKNKNKQTNSLEMNCEAACSQIEEFVFYSVGIKESKEVLK